ncbi:PREDICTED: uncharacterized protein LOC109179314 [Ipomoea nil]|uniref:uncharacterized protein LOC109179314 n=1 Tax=Ipomoea nil TaxID=35883 RepID=UPI000900D509|nr:PREDICTED: uncharacterized protein LOC109179314 [Ipomoea nil]
MDAVDGDRQQATALRFADDGGFRLQWRRSSNAVGRCGVATSSPKPRTASMEKSPPLISEDGVPKARGHVLGGSSAINVGFYSKADDVSAGAQEWTISGERLFAGMDSVRGFSLFLFLSSKFHAQIYCCCGSLRSYLLLLWEYAHIYSFYYIYNGTSDGGIEEVAAELEIGRFVPIFLHHSTLPLTIDEIVSAHQSSFEDDKYSEIKYLFPCNSWKMITENDVTVMISLLKSSKHEHFKKLISPLIKPLLRFLYLPCSSSDFMRNLGSAWLLIGGLCYHLLISYTYLEPTVKYSVKHSQLTEKNCLSPA